MVEVIVKIMRYMKKPLQNHETLDPKDPRIQTILRYLQDHYSESISLSELAFDMFFNKNYLCKLFKQNTGCTIHEYILDLRIQMACKLIKETDKSLQNIALQVGFSDYKNFFKVFKRTKKVSPLEYWKGN